MLEKLDCVHWKDNHRCNILHKKFTEVCGNCNFYETQQQWKTRLENFKNKK